MSSEMVNPHDSMVSFQECILKGIIPLVKVRGYKDLFSFVDEASPGVMRFTYARLTADGRTVKAFISCVKNGFHEGNQCISVGYAVPECYRRQGLATEILRDAVNDLLFQAGKNGIERLVIDSVIDKTNVESQQVTEKALNCVKESIIDSVSQKPAFQYTAIYDTSSHITASSRN
jgi:hypothetical protein